MDDNHLIDRLGGTGALSKRLEIAPASVSEWRTKGIPRGRRIELGADIERLAGVPRWVQRPKDWHRIWPELIGADGAPAVPAEQEARDAA